MRSIGKAHRSAEDFFQLALDILGQAVKGRVDFVLVGVSKAVDVQKQHTRRVKNRQDHA